MFVSTNFDTVFDDKAQMHGFVINNDGNIIYNL